MSNEVNAQREIHAPADTVWAMISDVTRMGEWSPETTSCTWLKGATGPDVGAKFKGSNRNGSKRWTTTCTVVESQPGSAFVFRVDVGPVKVAQWAYRLTPTADGCTVTETWTDRRSSFIARLGKPLSGVADRSVHNLAGMEQTLARLAEVAEQQP
jgi:uncharacterized protein YndB with AHSA1/START domain